MLPEHFFEDMRGIRERGIDVAVGEREAGDDVRSKIAVRARGVVLDGGAAIAGGGKHVVIDDDRRRGVLGEIARIGDHDGDRLADVTGFIARQCRLRPRRRDGRIGRKHRDRHPAHRLGQVVGGRAPHGRRASPWPRCCRCARSNACACGERTKQACSRPGSFRSSTKRPRPDSSAGSSSRFTRAPKCFAPIA